MPHRLEVLLLTSALFVVPFAIMLTNSPGNAQEALDLTPDEYAIGSTRFAAVAKKVTPSLKEAFRQNDLTWKSPIFIRAFKEERILELWVKKQDQFVLFKSYPIAGTSGILGPKQGEGDRQIPEGFYYVTPRQMNPQSQFHLSFNIGYPNDFDRAHQRDGTFIVVHGSDVSIGCLAMTDEKIEEIYTLASAAFDGGQKFFRIHLFPFRMAEENMETHSDSEWFPFWQNLQTGYQWFERRKVPPNVTVNGKRYHFE